MPVVTCLKVKKSLKFRLWSSRSAKSQNRVCNNESEARTKYGAVSKSISDSLFPRICWILIDLNLNLFIELSDFHSFISMKYLLINSRKKSKALFSLIFMNLLSKNPFLRFDSSHVVKLVVKLISNANSNFVFN